MIEFKNTEKVTIIVPIYNTEKYLEKCIQSIQEQTYSNIEIILIDDCSNDNSLKIAQTICTGDNRCKIFSHSKNKGLAATRNTGIRVAQGKWLVFVDSDDWIDTSMIEKMLDCAIQYDADIVLTDSCKVYSNGKKIIDNLLKGVSNNSSRETILTSVEQMSATRKLIRKDLMILNDLMFIETIKRSEDIPVIYPLMERANRISMVDEPLYYYYQRENSLSHQNVMCDISFYDEIEAILKKRCNPNMSEELEYRMIFEFMYGRTYIMLDAGYNFGDIHKKIIDFTNKYPKWKKNMYLKKMNILRRIFIHLASCNLLIACKLLIIIKKKIM